MAALERVLELERALHDRVDAEARWLSSNWTRFSSHTQSNPTFVYPRSQFLSVVGTVANQPSVGSAMMTSLGSTARSMSVGKAAEGGALLAEGVATRTLGKVISWGLGKAFPVLFDLAWGIIEDYQMQKKVSEMLHKRSVSQGEQTDAQLEFFHEQATAAKAQDRSGLDAIRASVVEMRTKQEVDAFDGWVHTRFAELPPLRDRSDISLFQDMLANWVLQHAGDLEGPNDETDEVEFESAAEKVEESPAKKVVEEGRRSLYVHQLKYALARHGLSADTVDKLPKGGVRGSTPLPGVRIENPNVFATAIARHDRSADAGRIPEHLGPAKRGDVEVSCKFECDFEEGSPLLEIVEFTATCVGRSRAAWHRGTTLIDENVSGGFEVVKWDYEPT